MKTARKFSAQLATKEPRWFSRNETQQQTYPRSDGAATAIEANVGGELDQEEHQQTEDRGENYNDRD